MPKFLKFWKCELNTPIRLCSILNSGAISNFTSETVCFMSLNNVNKWVGHSIHPSKGCLRYMPHPVQTNLIKTT